MKYKIFASLSFVAAITLFGCLRDECTSEQTYVRYDPIYKPISEIRADIKVEPARTLHNPGKIYAFGQYLFINEKQEGIHIIDNSDPANPVTLAFWSIPGNVDIAIHGNSLYADQYIDLITIDISDIQQPKVVCRNEAVFQLYGFDPVNGYLVDYKQTPVTEKVKCGDGRVYDTWFMEGDVLFVNSTMAAASNGHQSVPSNIGIAGSFARFGLDDKYLYTMDNFMMRTWLVGNNTCLEKTDSIWLGWNAETIFPWKNRLFVGTQTGMMIFNNSNQGHPVQEAVFSHASGCDPVVCDDNNAYVTIHDGTTCNGTFNQLDIIGIANLPTTTLEKSLPMTHPMGLSITNDRLFLCDDGLKIFDRSNPVEITELSHTKNINAYDVISFSDTHLMLIGDDGFFQFDVSDPTAPKQLSLIPVAR